MLEDVLMNNHIFVVAVDMNNKSAEDIAKEAAFKIIGITDQMLERQEAEKRALLRIIIPAVQ